MENKKVYIIILNYNGWQDTIECLESVFKLDYPKYQVIVCDNASSNDSLAKIKAWADGKLLAPMGANKTVQQYVLPYIPKPIKYVEHNREEAEYGGNTHYKDLRLILIQTGDNLGFAGGNNVGIRYALRKNDFGYIWLLNNDTVVETNALKHLVRRMAQRPDAGICGSTLIYYDKTNIVQSRCGGTYNKWTGTGIHLDSFLDVDCPCDIENIEKQMAYVVGASMLVSKSFLGDIGLMSEAYFLYFEELDWAVRAKNKYHLAYALESVVYHKEGSSIGANGLTEEKSSIGMYYLLKNRFVFTRKYYPLIIPLIWGRLFLSLLKAICRRRANYAKVILKVLFGC